MRKKRLLILIGTVCLSLMLLVPFGAACAKPAPAPAPAPSPAPAPAPAPAPTPTPAPASAPAPLAPDSWSIGPGSGETFTWKCNWDATWGNKAAHGMWMPKAHFQDMVESWSGGRLKLEMTPLLFEPAEAFYAVADGRCDLSTFGITFVSGTYPLWNYSALPFIFNDNYEVTRASFDSRLRGIIDPQYRELGAIRLAQCDSSPMDVVYGKKIEKLEDFAGLKVRTTGTVLTSTFKALGTSPLSIPGGELEEALRRGTVDAVCTTRSYGWAIGLADVCPYVNVWNGVGGFWGQALVCNAKKFDALPAELQQILMDASREAAFRVAYGCIADKLMLDKVLARGKADFLTASPAAIQNARDATSEVIDEWLGVAGPDAPEVLSILKEYGTLD